MMYLIPIFAGLAVALGILGVGEAVANYFSGEVRYIAVVPAAVFASMFGGALAGSAVGMLRGGCADSPARCRVGVAVLVIWSCGQYWADAISTSVILTEAFGMLLGEGSLTHA